MTSTPSATLTDIQNQLDVISLKSGKDRCKVNNIINKSISNEDRPDLFSAVWLTLLDYVRRLVRFFTLTEEERFKAGIYTGGEGRER